MVGGEKGKHTCVLARLSRPSQAKGECGTCVNGLLKIARVFAYILQCAGPPYKHDISDDSRINLFELRFCLFPLLRHRVISPSRALARILAILHWDRTNMVFGKCLRVAVHSRPLWSSWIQVRWGCIPSTLMPVASIYHHQQHGHHSCSRCCTWKVHILRTNLLFDYVDYVRFVVLNQHEYLY